MGLTIQDSGKVVSDMEKASSSGRMVLLTKDNGSWGEHKEKACSHMFKDRDMKESGTTMLLKALEFIHIITKQNTKVNGMQICKTEKEQRNGLMVLSL